MCLTANVTAKTGKVNLGNLFVLGAAAQAKQVSGTLVIQLLGLSVDVVSSLIPIPCEINPTTIQNALMVMGEINPRCTMGKLPLCRDWLVFTPTLVEGRKQLTDSYLPFWKSR